MLPVQVRIVSASSCTLAQACALLERFLSSDACSDSDSFATDYVANVAQALQDSISRRVGGPELLTKHRHFPASSSCSSMKQSTLVAGNPAPSSLSAAEDAVVAMEVRSAMPEADGAFKRHKKKRRHSAADNGLETDRPPASEMEDSAFMHHGRKRRKKEKHERETEDYGTDDQRHGDRKKRKEEQEVETENAVSENPAPDSQNLHDKKRRKKEKQGRSMEATENRGSPVSLSVNENLDKKSVQKEGRVM